MISLLAAVVAACAGVVHGANENVLLIHLDDFGYWDTSVINQGQATHRMWYFDVPSKTVNMERIAEEGIAFTSWYSPHPVCTPSRASILTGRYPIRTGLFPGVLTPNEATGLPHDEMTIAKILKSQGYRTVMAGKSHLGHVLVENKDGTNDTYLPMSFGFDSWTGIPWSHDYCPCPASLTHTNDTTCRDTDPPCARYTDYEVLQQPAILANLTNYYAQWVIQETAAAAEANTPFFAYWAPQHTHHPQFANPADVNASLRMGARGDAFGDSVVEVDKAIGAVFDAITQNPKLAKNTFIFLASDNGASLIRFNNGGDPGPLRCGKGTTWEGGQRTPALAWGPGIRKGVRDDGLGGSVDLLPTILSLLGFKDLIPSDRPIDGVDLSDFMVHGGVSPRTHYFYYGLTGTLQAVRVGKYKVHYFTSRWGASPTEMCDIPGVPQGNYTEHPLVFDLSVDIGESHPLDNSTEEYKQAVAQAAAAAAAHNCYNTKDACAGKLTPICTAKDKTDIAPWPPKPFKAWVPTCPDSNPHDAAHASEDLVILDYDDSLTVDDYAKMPAHFRINFYGQLLNPYTFL